MARRFSWKSTLRISLVTIPVRAFTATEPAQGRIHFHQLHAKCKNRIRYAKTCPVHGEVTELIEAKIKGKEVSVEREEEGPRVINLMEALRKSVAKTSAHDQDRSRPARRVAQKRRRKTG